MLPKRYTYLLFFLAYIGALVVEKPAYNVSTVKACFSYLFTILVHFSLFWMMISSNSLFLIPQLLEKKRFGMYVGCLFGVILLYTIAANHYNDFIHNTLFHDRPLDTSSGFWDNFVYALCCSAITSMLYIT